MENLCNVCPRNCFANRKKSVGFCGAKDLAQISKVMIHHFEEPVISGDPNSSQGSGTIFFSGCTLKCSYCQNSIISSTSNGKPVSAQTLADLFKQLENAGAFNINLVTPTQFTNQIVEALNIYRPNIPIVWNTSGYEKLETIKKIASYVDIFLVDLKYLDSTLSKKYSLAPDYPEIATQAIIQMRKNQPIDVFENGIMQKGIIVRHLVLPTHTQDTLNVINWINSNLGNKTYFSLMSQYVPMANASKHPEINRRINALEYKIPVKKLEELGFENAFLQEFSSAETIYTPDFNTNDSIFKF